MPATRCHVTLLMTAVGRPICRRSITVFNLTFLSPRRHIIGRPTMVGGLPRPTRSVRRVQEPPVTGSGRTRDDSAWKTPLNDAAESDDKLLGATAVSKGEPELRPQDTSAPQNWCRSVRTLRHQVWVRGPKCSDFSSIQCRSVLCRSVR